MSVVTAGPEKAARSEAIAWLLRVRNGALSPAEERAFEAWRSQSVNAAAYQQADRLWAATGELATRPEIVRLRESVQAQTDARPTRLSLAVAASVVILLLSGLVAVTATNSTTPLGKSLTVALERARTTVSTAPGQGTFTTAIGQRSTVTLRDGSVLTLNTDSAAEVAYTDRERRITLTRGQALFEVAKGQSRPFIVQAGDRQIVATGTAFDVRLADAAVEVTLVEGHVHVDPLTAQTTGSKAMRQAELRAGERLIAKAGLDVSITEANVDRVTSWTTGRLVFLDTRLADAVAEANRYTNTPIALADAKLADLRVNGVFRAGQPAEFARAVSQIYPVVVDESAGGQVRIAPKAE